MQTAAAFSIVNYMFDKVFIELGNHKNNNLSLSFETNGVFVNESSTFELTFSIDAFNEGEEINPFVKIQCRGIFKFENVTGVEEIPEFFYRNSIAILFPYVRAYVSLVTTQANVPGLILPTLNLSNLGDKLKTNTTVR